MLSIKNCLQRRSGYLPNILLFLAIVSWFSFHNSSAATNFDITMGEFVTVLALSGVISLYAVSATNLLNPYVVATSLSLSFATLELQSNGFFHSALGFASVQLGTLGSGLESAVTFGLWIGTAFLCVVTPTFRRRMAFIFTTMIAFVLPLINETLVVTGTVMSTIQAVQLLLVVWISGFYVMLPAEEELRVRMSLKMITSFASLLLSCVGFFAYCEIPFDWLYMSLLGCLMMSAVVVRMALLGAVERGCFAGLLFSIVMFAILLFPHWGGNFDLLSDFIQVDGIYVGLYASAFCVLIFAVFFVTMVEATPPVTLLFILFNFILGLLAYASKFEFLESALDSSGFSVVVGSPEVFSYVLVALAVVSSFVWRKAVDSALSIYMVLMSLGAILLTYIFLIGNGGGVTATNVFESYIAMVAKWMPITLVGVFVFSGTLKRSAYSNRINEQPDEL